MKGTINQLQKENFSVWQIRMTDVLIYNNLWNLVNEDRKCPAKPENLEDGAALTDEEIIEWKKAADAFDEWTIDCSRAAAILLESISDPLISVIKPVAKDPVQVWKTLQEKFAPQSETGKSAA